ncbi:MAG TPA: DR2241 family protein [Chthoniobacterales bacterium]|nr:DR2241 family protein [Chthoniobacterales bacterium]
MPDSIETALASALIDSFRFGQILIQKKNGGYSLSHRDDGGRDDLQGFQNPDEAAEIARYDDEGNYRPLKTAPNLRHGWRLEVVDLAALRRALDYFYPGRLAMFAAWKANRFATTPLRETLDRQSGMYRVAAKISDEQIDELLGNFCRSSDGCLRTILWKRDARGTVPSLKLPPEKFDTSHDQTGCGERTIPLLCQEACNLLVNEARKVVKGE